MDAVIQETSTLELVQEMAGQMDRCTNLVAATNAISSNVMNCMRIAPEFVHVEGFPGRRFHEGASYLDGIELHGEQVARDLFDSEHAILQSWRCTNGIVACVRALAKPGDTVLGLACDSGGFYATGSDRAHLLSKLYRIATYSVSKDTHLLNYDTILQDAIESRPTVIFCGDTSYSRLWNWQRMRQIADQVGAYLVADISQTAGLVAGKLIPSPVGIADVCVFATYKTLRGPKGCIILAEDTDVSKRIRSKIYPELQGSVSSAQIVGITACLEEARLPSFTKYCAAVIKNAQFLSAALMRHGLQVVTKGTDNHSLTVIVPDDAPVDANEICKRLAKRKILTNKTPIPFDKRSLNACSGVRLGTAYVTSEAVTPGELKRAADTIAETFHDLTAPVGAA